MGNSSEKGWYQMDNDIFAVEETTASQTAPETTQETTATPQTDLTPNAEQQETLNRIRNASQEAGTFQLQNGRVVLAKSERTEQARTEQTTEEPTVELNWRGQVVQKPLTEVRNLAQKGFDYEAKNFEINQQRQALAQREAELNQMFQSVQGILPQKPQQPQQQPQSMDEAQIISSAMNAVKERFGSDDPSFEYDPLSPEQAAVYNMALYRGVQTATEAEKAALAEQRQRQERDLRLNGWEEQQRAADPLYDETAKWALEPIGRDTSGKEIPRIHEILNGVQLKAFENALATGDTATLSRVANYCKAKYQQQKLGITTRSSVAVPVVQPPGNGQPLHQQQSAKTWPKTEHNIPQEQRIELWKARFAKK